MDLEYTMYRASRALELLKNYIEFGVVTGVPKKQRQEFSDAYRPLMTAFADGEARRGLAEGTMKSLWSRLYRLYLFLTDKGADAFSMVTRDMINDFIKYLAPYSTTYVSENLRMLRRLSLYAFQNGYHDRERPENTDCPAFVRPGDPVKSIYEGLQTRTGSQYTPIVLQPQRRKIYKSRHCVHFKKICGYGTQHIS
jgi:hypothetical protein